MTLSVVVTSYEALRSLSQCLESLTAQPEASQILVVDCSAEDPAPLLRERFPRVEFLHFDEVKTMPELRWIALERLTGDVIGAIEARSIPAPDWCEKMLAAHAAHPDADAVGGPVAHAEGVCASQAAMYFAEYSGYAPDLRGLPDALTEANFTFKRSAALRHREFLQSGEWEHFLRDRLEVRLSDAVVEFRHDGLSRRKMCGQRFHYGRNYAAARAEREGRSKALFYAAASPVLPAVLTCRGWRSTRGKPAGSEFPRALPWLLLLNSLWAAGEAIGYLAGATAKKYIY